MLETMSRSALGPDQVPSSPWLSMDSYFGTDSLSLQEMLDVDIRCEIEDVIDGHNDIHGDYSFSIGDLPQIELDDNPVVLNDLHKTLNSSNLLNGNSNSNSSNSNFHLDLSNDVTSIMVNPNSVMPHMATHNSMSNINKRHFSFTPKIEIKEEKIDVENELDNDEDVENENDNDNDENDNDNDNENDDNDNDNDNDHENDHENDNDNDNDNENDIDQDNENDQENYNEADTEIEQYENDITETEDDTEDEQEIIRPAVTLLRTKPPHTISLNTAIKTISPQITKTHLSSKINGLPGIRVQNFKVLQSTQPSQQSQHVRKQIYNNNYHHVNNSSSSTISIRKEFDLSDFEDKLYPKPAYSYSCLIAMALKNSQTGSLPVSEIYNFMCEHFPYFKTAPNGWKNSVRHNLSLNKCFEKIEKPAGNGNQRKGCLWAINPAKVAKMDEEVQKWSRKDPLAIKKAMICPDHLELLERGEMKYVGSSGEMSEENESSSDETAEESAVYDESMHNHIAANSVTDSYDESSQDCDIDIKEHIYDEIDIDEKDALHMQLNITKQETIGYELSPCTKKRKTLTGSIQGNYVYQPVTTSRRKTPLLLRAETTAEPLLKIE